MFKKLSTMVLLLLVLTGCTLYARPEPDPVLVTGTVTDLEGNPLADVLIQASDGSTAESEVDGSFAIQVRPGKVTLVARKGIYNGELVVTVLEGQPLEGVLLALRDYWSLTEFDDADLSAWHLQSWTTAECGIDVANGIATLWYQDTPTRDLAGWGVENQTFPAGYNQLAFRVKLSPGAYLTTELWVENNWQATQKITNYYEGTGDWEIIRFPIDPELTGFFKFQVSISEPGDRDYQGARVEQYWDWIRLEWAPEEE